MAAQSVTSAHVFETPVRAPGACVTRHRALPFEARLELEEASRAAYRLAWDGIGEPATVRDRLRRAADLFQQDAIGFWPVVSLPGLWRLGHSDWRPNGRDERALRIAHDAVRSQSESGAGVLWAVYGDSPEAVRHVVKRLPPRVEPYSVPLAQCLTHLHVLGDCLVYRPPCDAPTIRTKQPLVSVPRP